MQLEIKKNGIHFEAIPRLNHAWKRPFQRKSVCPNSDGQKSKIFKITIFQYRKRAPSLHSIAVWLSENVSAFPH